MHAEDILDRLIYVKNRLLLRHKEDETRIAQLFPVQNLVAISQAIPQDLNQLRLLVETRKWTADEDRAFVTYGNFLVQEICHYLRVYGPSSEPAEEVGTGEQHNTSEYSLRDYEPFAALLAESNENDLDPPEPVSMPESENQTKPAETTAKRTYFETFKSSGDSGKAKKPKKGESFL